MVHRESPWHLLVLRPARLGRGLDVGLAPILYDLYMTEMAVSAACEHLAEVIDSAELALARDEDDYIPWEQVKADLGLT